MLTIPAEQEWTDKYVNENGKRTERTIGEQFGISKKRRKSLPATSKRRLPLNAQRPVNAPSFGQQQMDMARPTLETSASRKGGVRTWDPRTKDSR